MNFESNKKIAKSWFENLQNEICLNLEKLEEDYNSQKAQKFNKKIWNYHQDGGGQMAILTNGSIFEKAGVNFSCVSGKFSDEFAKTIMGAEHDPSFWASGISIVIHPINPHVPIIHMNTRHIITTKSWFGGGIDLTPVISYDDDTNFLHKNLKNICDNHDEGYYPKFKNWCDKYFYIEHRKEPRGVGGIFYDYLDNNSFEKDFNFNKDVGNAFLKIYKPIVEKRVHQEWNVQDKKKQLIKRGRYVEFNLIYDRGTKFGLKTGGNTDAILMSLPPLAIWE